MFQEYPDILTPVQASKALRIGTKTFYSLIRERKLGHIRIGKKILVPKYCLALLHPPIVPPPFGLLSEPWRGVSSSGGYPGVHLKTCLPPASRPTHALNLKDTIFFPLISSWMYTLFTVLSTAKRVEFDLTC